MIIQNHTKLANIHAKSAKIVWIYLFFIAEIEEDRYNSQMNTQYPPLPYPQSFWLRLSMLIINVYDTQHVCRMITEHVAHDLKRDCFAFLYDEHDIAEYWIGRAGEKSSIGTYDKNPTLFTMDQPLNERQPLFFFHIETEEVRPIHKPPQDWVTDKNWFITMFIPQSRYSPRAGIGMRGMDLRNDQDLIFLYAVTAYVKTFIERADVAQLINQQSILFDIIHDTSRIIMGSLDLNELPPILFDHIQNLLNVEHIFFALTENGSQNEAMIDPALFPFFKKQYHLPLDEGVIGWCMKNKQAVRINHVEHDTRFSAEIHRRIGIETENICCVPLYTQNRLYGVLVTINKKYGLFEQIDENILQALANPLVVAIDNAHLHRKVREAKRQLESMFEHMGEGMIVIDEEGIILETNTAYCSMIGLSQEQVLNHPLETVMKIEDQLLSDVLVDISQTKESDTHQVACTIYHSHISNASAVLLNGLNIPSDDGVKNKLIILSDLSQVRQVERMREDFFQGVVHELRTPLASALLYARMVSMSLNSEAATTPATINRAKDQVKIIEEQIDHLQSMVSQMMELVKMEGKFKSTRPHEEVQIDVNKMLMKIILPLSAQARQKGLSFKTEIREDLPTISGVKSILHTVLKNLVDNAIKFTQDGTVKVTAQLDGTDIVVTVSDEGIGIPEESRSRLFTRFYRSQTAMEAQIAGTGLGLYMVKQGVERHHGTIDFVSEVGKGTTFTAILPTIREEAE